MSAQSWENILWYRGHLAAGGISGLKLSDWKHPAFSETTGFGFPVKMSSYKLKTSTSAALTFFLGILVSVYSISFKGSSWTPLLLQLQSLIPATHCGDDGNHPQVVEEQSDPPRMTAQYSWLHPWGYFLHSSFHCFGSLWLLPGRSCVCSCDVRLSTSLSKVLFL